MITSSRKISDTFDILFSFVMCLPTNMARFSINLCSALLKSLVVCDPQSFNA